MTAAKPAEARKPRGRPRGTGKGSEVDRAKRNAEICELYVNEGLSYAELGRRFDLDPTFIKRIIDEHIGSFLPETERQTMALAQLARYQALLAKWMPVALMNRKVPFVTKEGEVIEVPLGIDDGAKGARVVLDVMSKIDKRFALEDVALDPDGDLDDSVIAAELNALLTKAEAAAAEARAQRSA